MKGIIVSVLVFILFISFSGCGTDEVKNTDSTTILSSAKSSNNYFSGNIKDVAGNTSFEFIDIINTELVSNNGKVLAKIELANLPSVFIFNKAEPTVLEYSWNIFFDTDGKSNTGSSLNRGAEYNLCLTYSSKSSKQNEFYGSLQDNCVASVNRLPTNSELEKNKNIIWFPERIASVTINKNTIILQGEIPEINSNTRWWAETSYYPGAKANIKRELRSDRAPKQGSLRLIPGEKNTLDEKSMQLLAEKFAPILYLHPDETYEPKEVSILVDNAEIKKKDGSLVVLPGFNNASSEERLNMIGKLQREDYYLDFKGAKLNDGSGKYREEYNKIKDKYKTTVYARVVQQEGKTIIQYWFFYFFNDGPINKHEGDWEMIQLVFDNLDFLTIEMKDLIFVSISAHGDPLKNKKEEIHWQLNYPIIYIALGSHASYKDYLLKPNRFLDITSNGERKVDYSLDFLSNQAWLSFYGYWGEYNIERIWLTGTQEQLYTQPGPIGPANPNQKIWNNPLE